MENVKLRTDMSSSTKIFSDGSGLVEFNKRFLEFAYGNKFNGIYQGIIIDGVGYYQALKVSQPFSMSDVRWYNDKLEICDWNTKVKKKDAVSQPFSKKQLPDPLL